MHVTLFPEITDVSDHHQINMMLPVIVQNVFPLFYFPISKTSHTVQNIYVSTAFFNSLAYLPLQSIKAYKLLRYTALPLPIPRSLVAD
jgi:hypothetical protein